MHGRPAGPDVDRLIDRALAEPDQARRAALWAESGQAARTTGQAVVSATGASTITGIRRCGTRRSYAAHPG